MKKITYIANARMPTEKAHGIQIAKMCEAFADAGADVTLVLPKRMNSIQKDLFVYYGVKKNFSVRKIFCIDFLEVIPFGKAFSFWIESWTFALSVLRHAPQDGMVYTRDLSSLFFLRKHVKIAYEAHSFPKNPGWLFRFLVKKADTIVVISRGLRDAFIAFGIPEKNICVAPDAVDPKEFFVEESPKACRKKFGLPLDTSIVMYTGHLYAWKGAETLLAAAALLPDTQFVFVGGTKEDAGRFQKDIERQQLHNVRLISHTAHENIPAYLHAADVLVIPNSAKEKISSFYTSPLKLFEYMAARKPIVASDLPSLREILDESTATFFAPDDFQSLAEAIRLTLSHGEESAQKADRAYTVVQQHTWRSRAEKILHLSEIV